MEKQHPTFTKRQGVHSETAPVSSETKIFNKTEFMKSLGQIVAWAEEVVEEQENASNSKKNR